VWKCGRLLVVCVWKCGRLLVKTPEMVAAVAKLVGAGVPEASAPFVAKGADRV
jgi:hypothetical protein